MEENESILESIRDGCGLAKDDDSFDGELLMHINSALAVLNTNDAGRPVYVVSDKTKWSEFLDPAEVQTNTTMLPVIKSYVFLKTRTLFDPPPPSLVPVYTETINELLWRIREEYSYGKEVK